MPRYPGPFMEVYSNMTTEDHALVLPLIALQDALGGQYGELSRPKLRLMVKLKRGPLTVSALASQLNISSPGVSQMLDKLQTDGFVKRETLSADQRVVGVALTSSGHEALGIAITAFEARIRSLLVNLNEEEVEQITQILRKMTASYSASGKKMNA